MNDEIKAKANTFFYNMTKRFASDSFEERLEDCGLTNDEWDVIKMELAKIGITETYC